MADYIEKWAVSGTETFVRVNSQTDAVKAGLNVLLGLAAKTDHVYYAYGAERQGYVGLNEKVTLMLSGATKPSQSMCSIEGVEECRARAEFRSPGNGMGADSVVRLVCDVITLPDDAEAEIAEKSQNCSDCHAAAAANLLEWLELLPDAIAMPLPLPAGS